MKRRRAILGGIFSALAIDTCKAQSGTATSRAAIPQAPPEPLVWPIATKLQPGIAYGARRAVEADRRDLIAPGIDGADAMPRGGIDDLQEITLLADRRGIQGQPVVIGGEITHHASMPRVESTASMRRVASSGLASRPALSASRKSSARCSVERALSWPPTMVK